MTGALFAWPAQAHYGKLLPKNKLYERASVSTRLRELFVSQVERIVWSYKLAPETINLPSKQGAPEIQIFSIQLKTSELDYDVLRCIDGAVPYPILFELSHAQGEETRTRMVAAYKRPGESDTGHWAISDYFAGDWQAASITRVPMPLALDLASLYERLLHGLIPLPARARESLADLITRVEQATAKRREVERAQAKLAREKQFNRKVEINAELRRLKAELEALHQ